MKLVVFGDSWVEGYRLYPKHAVNNLNICHYISEFIPEINVENIGFRGNSNASIASSVLEYVQNNDTKDCVFLVSFTEWNRHSLVEDDNQIKPEYKIVNFRSGSVEESISKELKRRITLEFHRYNYQSAYYSVLGICQSMGIPVRFTNSICDQQLHSHVYDSYENRFVRLPFVSMKKYWIEPDTNYNTMYDILTGDWLDQRDNVSYLMRREKYNKERKHSERYFTRCIHPTAEGSRLIAKTLCPYIEQMLF